MNSLLLTPEPVHQDSPLAYTGPCRVVGEASDRGHVRVVLPGGDEADAELAMVEAPELLVGDRVLVTASGDHAWVIGVLGESRRRIRARTGASAEIVRTGEGQDRIRVLDEDDSILFEYNPEQNRGELRMPRGDLDITAPGGNLTLGAGGSVRLCGESVDMMATSALRMGVRDLASGELNTIRLGQQGTRIDTRRTTLATGDIDVQMSRTRVRGDSVSSRVGVVRTTADRIETVAETVTQEIGSLYQNVRELLQTRAGRLRTLVKGVWQTRSRRADLKSKETFRVDGERIHLG